ncbi:eCIS core domain-containing protein [Candidatus Electronema sp. TJ]|uniref:eCIS core domain-containing protein n=1 Tax=Candidatus Electronema sp. TJ TaxID=3401573 RepID=UPI003AA9930D
MQAEIVHRFKTVLPKVREWIDHVVQDHAPQARAASSLGFKQLPDFFPQDLIEQVKVVTAAHIPIPPLSSFGLPELAALEQMSAGGITFQNTVFLQVSQASESLLLHELVHVVQWNRLGPDNFLLAYGIGLMQFGYRESPLEQIAYSLQARFDAGILRPGLAVAAEIEQHADAVWASAAPILAAA